MDRLHTLMQREDVVEASLPEIGSKTRAAIIAKGVMLEQDRIIELLDEAFTGIDCIDKQMGNHYLSLAIQLIEGETK